MLVTMSDKEIHRLPVIQAVCEKRLRRRDAASQLGISERQAQRLINRYRVSGAEGLVSRKRGQVDVRDPSQRCGVARMHEACERRSYSAADVSRRRADSSCQLSAVGNSLSLNSLPW